MNRIKLDAVAIVLILGFSLIMNYMGWLEQYYYFAMIPFIGFYYLGKYTQGKQSRIN